MGGCVLESEAKKNSAFSTIAEIVRSKNEVSTVR